MKASIVLMVALACYLWATEPIVLQNGTNGYTGIEDSYLNKHMFHTKYGDSSVIKTRFEDCSD